jgi:glycine/D-amino acid oxidase-like deaminating enzyme
VIDPLNQTRRVAETFNEMAEDRGIRIGSRKAKIDFRMLEGRDILRYKPYFHVDPEYLNDTIAYDERGSGTMFMERCVRAQIYMAQAAGANITTDKVREIQKTGHTFKVMFDDGEFMLVDDVVVAAGPWTNDLLGSRLQGRIKTTKQFTAWYRASHPERYSLMNTHSNFVFFLRKGGFVYGFASLGGYIKAAHELGEGVYPHGYVPGRASSKDLSALYDMTSPNLPVMTPDVKSSSTCLYTIFEDTVGYMGRDPETGAYVKQNCRGENAKHAAAQARWIINEITGRARNDNDHRDLSAYGPSQLSLV